MEHADTAQLAAIVGALGSVLVLLARGRGRAARRLGGARAGRGGAGRLARARAARQAEQPRRGGRGAGGPGGARARPRRCWPAAGAGARRRCSLAAPFRPPLAFDSSSAPSWSRWPRTAASDGCCRSTSCSPRPVPRSAGGRCAAARVRALPAPDRPAGGGLLRLRLLLAGLGRRPGGGRQPARLLHAAVRRPAGHRGPGGLPGLGAARCWRRSPSCSPRSSPRWGCGRRPRTSCSSTRPTWRCRTRTPTTSA